MTFDIEPISPDEFDAFIQVDVDAFGSAVEEEQRTFLREWVEWDRTLAARDGSRIVGSAAAVSFRLSLPGGTAADAAGVTWVSVLPTHRRRGILTAMMRRQLESVRKRGEALAILYASESLIYGRFGYGMSTSHTDWQIERRHAALQKRISIDDRIDIVYPEQAAEILPPVFARVAPAQPGQVNRGDAYWRQWLSDPVRWRDGAGIRHYVVHRDEGGEVDGYCAYRIRDSWPHGNPDNTLEVSELIAGSAQAYASLWGYCLSVDLTGSINAHHRPTDEPLRWMLAEPRRMRTTRITDALWARLVDIPAALEARRYNRDGTVVLEIADDFIPENAGRYELQGGPEGCFARRTRRRADLALSVADLGAIYLGGVAPSLLARAQRAHELRPGALRCVDDMFTADVAPWCSTFF